MKKIIALFLVVFAANSFAQECIQEQAVEESYPSKNIASCEFVNSRGKIQQFEKKLTKIHDDGATVANDKLQEQLSRDHFALKLKKQSRGRLSATKVYERCRESVVMVGGTYLCGRCDKLHASVASGFIIDEDGIIVTNHHVVKGEKNKTLGIMTYGGEVYPVLEVLAADKKNDLALLKIDAKNLKALPVSTIDPVGSQVYVLHHPKNNLYVMTDGMIAQYFKEDGRAHKKDAMAITADFARGSSGAPILNDHGAVVGVVRATQPVYYEMKEGRGDKIQMVWKMCVPAVKLAELTDGEK